MAQKITDLPRHRVGYQGIDLPLWWGRRVFRILWAWQNDWETWQHAGIDLGIRNRP